MKSQEPGTNISGVEVLNIGMHGIWLFLNGAEYFLPYKGYPWFANAKVSDILDVRLLNDNHLHWPSLDVDLSVKSLGNPDAYPLVYR